MLRKILTLMFISMICAGCELINPTITYPVSTNSTSAVLVIIESSYAGWNPGAVADMNIMSNMLSEVTDDIVILKDGRATRKNVKEAITKACSNELAIIFFTCHGGQEKAAKADRMFEKDGYDEFIYLSDSTITDNELWDIFKTSTNRIFTIFNCCNSGTMFRNSVIPSQTDSNVFSPFCETAYSDNGPDLLSWSACRDGYAAITQKTGGIFVQSINNMYNTFSKNISYNQAWTILRYSSDASKRATPELNVVGDYEKFQDRQLFR